MLTYAVAARRSLLSITTLVGLVACHESTPPGPTVAKVVVTPSATTGTAGTALDFSATAFDADGNPLSGVHFTWRASDNTIAKVLLVNDSPASAQIMPWRAGSTSIIATTEGTSGVATINVVPGPAVRIIIQPNAVELMVGEARQFTTQEADVAGNTVYGAPVVWSSSDASVVAVDAATGLAHGVARGDATISAKLNDQTSTPAEVLVLGVLAGVTTTDLGALQFQSSSATSINNVGAVVGSLGGPMDSPHAFLWTAASGMTDLGPNLIAYAINDQGQVAITQVGLPTNHAVRWSQSAGMQDLGVLTGGHNSAAYGINSGGDVVGASYAASGGPHAFVWTDRDGMRDLGLLTSGDDSSAAYSINDLGQVVGASFNDAGGYCYGYGYYCTRRSFLWTAARGLTDISGGSVNSFSLAINNSGQVVGARDDQAVLLQGGAVQTVSPSVVGAISSAYAVNSSGQVVGDRNTQNGDVTITHAFIWSLATGLQLLTSAQSGARGINDQGQVVGWMTDPNTHLTHAVLWTLPASLAAARRRP